MSDACKHQNARRLPQSGVQGTARYMHPLVRVDRQGLGGSVLG